MSISILNRGASGGLKPELTVIAPAGSTIDLLQNGIILDTYTLGASETEHTFVVKVGEYEARGTLDEKSYSVNVVIDSIGCYSAEIYYPIEVITDFAKKEANWTEYGGTMRYGNGVYVNKGDTKGTLTRSDGVLEKYVDIPCHVKLFDFSFTAYSYTSGNNAERGFYISLINDSGTGLVSLMAEDWWGVSNNQVWRASAYAIGSYDFAYATATYNGVYIPCRFVYDGSNIYFHFADAPVRTYAWDMPGDVAKIRICFTATSSNPMPESRIKDLKLLAL